MCGIAGLITPKGRAIDVAKFKESVDLVRYRGPDGEGFAFFGDFSEPQKSPDNSRFYPRHHQGFSLALGHRRLSILDLSEAGLQPMSTQDGRYWIVHNGEIYNYRELREELEFLGSTFTSGTDTEVALESYRHWGTQCVQRFNGMWAFAIFDKVDNTIFLSRDRFGVKPLYFSRAVDGFAFGSEIKQLRKLGFGTGRAHFEQSARYLFTGNTDDTRETMYEGIERLLPGEMLTWKLDSPDSAPEICSYYSPEIREYAGSADQWTKQFRDLLRDSVKLRLRADVPAGSCLSGGLDSSSLVMLVHELEPNFQQKTFTSRFSEPKFDEFEFAHLVNQRVNAESHSVYPDLQMLWSVDIDRLAFHQDEPFQSTSIYAQWKVMELARQNGVKVLLDGQGGDELLGGYLKYVPVYWADLLWSGKWIQLFGVASAMRKSGLLDQIGSSWRILGSAFAMGLGVSRVRTRRLKKFFKRGVVNSEMMSVPDGVGFKDHLKHDLQNALQTRLRYEDRNSMAHSIEARTPFLDYRLVEHVLAGNESWFFDGGVTKAPIRTALEGVLPEAVRNRKDKMGFVTPEFVWYKDNKAAIQAELLSVESPLWRWMDRTTVQKALETNEFGGLGFAPWRWLSFGRWMKANGLEYV